jgi:hypothetical protein
MEQILDEHKKTFYDENRKSMFFKKTQKFEFAEKVLNHVSLENLLEKTVYIIGENTNNIYIDYLIFKNYANPAVFREIIQYFLVFIGEIIQIHSSVNIHINLKSFSISAAERYKDVLCLFFEMGGIEYLPFINVICVYNTPSIIETIRTFFISKIPVLNTIPTPNFYTPKESLELLVQLFK